MSTVTLARIALPEASARLPQVTVSSSVFRQRCAAAYERSGVDWLAVYGDREHAGNMHYLCGFDPRFEEALLLLGPSGRVVLLAGNEGIVYGAITPDFVDVELAQTFSLMGQDRGQAARLDTCIKSIGVRQGDQVGLVGWKYLEQREADDQTDVTGDGFYVPSHVVSVLTHCAGSAPRDKTSVFMSPQDGLRSISTAAQIAEHTRAAINVSGAVFDVINHARPGVSEFELARRSGGHAADTLSIHPILASGPSGLNGLRSASERVLEGGDAIVHAVGHRYALTCRAGLVADAKQHEQYSSYLDELVFPYFGAISAWLMTAKDGVVGGDLWSVIDKQLEPSSFRSALNPGHLVGYEEWTHSPVRPGSADTLRSGMVMQLDIIPSTVKAGWATNCEDTVAIANRDLRDQLAREFPAAWASIVQNRRYLSDVFGIETSEDLLPLSPTTGFLPPFWLSPQSACVERG